MSLTIATWNVNGIRARSQQVLDWIARDAPDIVCLQETKARPDQLPALLFEPEDYWCRWHGHGGYSGVAIFVSRRIAPEAPAFAHPNFDFESRIMTVDVAGVRVASVYVPNGGKDFAAKMRFLADLDNFVLEAARDQKQVIICGDLNVAIAERDIHPKLRKPNQIGARPEERELLEQIISHGLVDVHRQFEPDNDNLFTWWAPWRNQKERNIGWRIDYVLASKTIADRAKSAVVQREIGSSDHGPVVVEFDFAEKS